MTLVRSCLMLPNGKPAVSVRVTLRILATPTWIADGTGRVLGTALTHTKDDGCWTINIVPYEDFELDEFVYAEIVERLEPGPSVHYMRVPRSTGVLQMRDLLVEDPKPPPPDTWRPISSLGTIKNVAKTADTPSEGQSLIAQADNTWAPGFHRFRKLHGVDEQSIAGAQPGDTLVMLTNGLWGVNRQLPPAELEMTTSRGGTDMAIKVTITTREPGKPLQIQWDADAEPPPPAETVPDDTNIVEKAYTASGVKHIVLGYTDGTHDVEDFVQLPWAVSS